MDPLPTAWHSEGQGFESPRVHQILYSRLLCLSLVKRLGGFDRLIDRLSDSIFESLKQGRLMSSDHAIWQAAQTNEELSHRLTGSTKPVPAAPFQT